jgi:hypothetical protein
MAVTRKDKHWRPGDHPRARRFIGAVLALAVLAAACGGSSGADNDGVASASGNKKAKSESKSRDPQQAGLDFARCMREHGVDVPDPQPGEGGLIRIGPGPEGGGGGPVEQPFSDEFAEADKACRHLLDDLIQDGDGQIDPKEQDRALKFAQCMREHGVNMPDPQFSGGAISLKITDVDPTSETFKEAQKACGHLGPGGAEPGLAPRGGSRA